MDPLIASKYVLKKFLESFDERKIGIPNEIYLEEQIAHLRRMICIYKEQSKNKNLSPRHRARARDLEQNAEGLLNGIMFAISFIHHKNTDLIGDKH